MRYRLYETHLTFANQTTTFATDKVPFANLGCDSYSCQANIDVNTPSAQVVASSSISSSTDTWTKTAHGFSTGLKVQLTTSSALPAPLTTSTDYFVIVLTVDTFQLASTLANAQAGTPIDLTNAGTGNQTVTPTALAGASIKLQESNVENPGTSAASTDWSDIATATNITVDAVFYLEKDRPTSKWVRVVVSLTAGQLTAILNQLAKGDREG